MNRQSDHCYRHIWLGFGASNGFEFRVQVGDTNRRYGKFWGTPISETSMRRIRRVLKNKCLLVDNYINPFGGITNEYEYLPDAPFKRHAQLIDAGASNPLAVVKMMYMLAYYRVLVEKTTIKDDPYWLLMLNQLGAMTGGREIDFTAYSLASKEVYSE